MGKQRFFDVPQRWQSLSLAAQFFVAGSAVLLIGMFIIGVWVTRQIADGVTRNVAASSALYMESVVSPLVQELARDSALSQDAVAKIDRLTEGTELGRELLSFKIWKQDGSIVYASRKSLVGMTFPVTSHLERAWRGQIVATFVGGTDESHDPTLERPLLEIYSPLRERLTGRIIAVGEFYETAAEIRDTLFQAKLNSWLVVAGVSLLMLALLSGIVLRGSRTIDRQRIALVQRVGELSRLLSQNEELRHRLQRASRRATEINERYLRRISADLHDGPAQLLALASLRLDAVKALIKGVRRPEAGRDDLDVVGESLADALAEIRSICTGLALPKLEDLSPQALLENAVTAHQRRTGTAVDLDIVSVPAALPQSLKICLYRFVQEALSNAYRHAGGVGQRLLCRTDHGSLRVEVSDTGAGFDASRSAATPGGLGMIGLRERIESLGGTLEISSVPGEGTSLVACFTLDSDKVIDDE